MASVATSRLAKIGNFIRTWPNILKVAANLIAHATICPEIHLNFVADTPFAAESPALVATFDLRVLPDLRLCQGAKRPMPAQPLKPKPNMRLTDFKSMPPNAIVGRSI